MKLSKIKMKLGLAALGVCLLGATFAEAKVSDWYGLPVGKSATIGAAIDINNVNRADGVMPTCRFINVPLKRYYSESAVKNVVEMLKNSGDRANKPWNQLAYSTCGLSLSYYPEYDVATYRYDPATYFKTDGTVIDGYNGMEAASGYPSEKENPIAAAAFEKLFNKKMSEDYSLVTELTAGDKAAGWTVIRSDNVRNLVVRDAEKASEYGPVLVREYYTKNTIKKLMAETCLEANYYGYEDMNNRSRYAYCQYELKFARRKDIAGNGAGSKDNTQMWMEIAGSRTYYDANHRPIKLGKTGSFEKPTSQNEWYTFEPVGQDEKYEFRDCYQDRLAAWTACQKRQDCPCRG